MLLEVWHLRCTVVFIISAQTYENIYKALAYKHIMLTMLYFLYTFV